MINQSPSDPTNNGAPLNGLRKVSVKFHGQKPGTNDPTTGASTQPVGPDHGIAEIALESHDPNKGAGGLAKEPSPASMTKLDPLSEALFPNWLLANGIDPKSIQDHHYDYRGQYMQSQGRIHSPGTISGAAGTFNKLQESRPPAIQAMMDSMPMASSHPPTLTRPGQPSLPSILTGKIGAMQSEGGDPNGDPLVSLRRMLAQQSMGQ